MSKYFDGELLSGYEESPKTTTSNTSDFVGLLNKEMDSLVDDYAKRRISDLEAKLAESEEELEQYKYAYENSMVLDYTSRKWLAVGSVQQENEQLKQQLAEKETRIAEEIDLSDKRRQIIEDLTIENRKLEQQLAEKEEKLNSTEIGEEFALKCCKEAEEQLEKQAKIHYRHLKEKDQDKISFCIEKLEKTKKDIENGWKMVGYEGLDFNEVIGTIDNQIEELKKEMK